MWVTTSGGVEGRESGGKLSLDPPIPPPRRRVPRDGEFPPPPLSPFHFLMPLVSVSRYGLAWVYQVSNSACFSARVSAILLLFHHIVPVFGMEAGEVRGEAAPERIGIIPQGPSRRPSYSL